MYNQRCFNRAIGSSLNLQNIFFILTFIDPDGKKKSYHAILEHRNSNNFRNKNKSDVIKLTSEDTPYTFSLKRRKRKQRGKVSMFCCCAS